jgi:diaminopimelate epimerase
MIDAREHTVPTASIIQQLCDRNHGIGADGVILLQRSATAHLKMRIFNRDGSEADMCGNGIRCLHAFARELHFPPALKIETASGVYTTNEIKDHSNEPLHNTTMVTVNIDSPKLSVQSHMIDGIVCESTYTGTQHLVCPVENILTVDVNKVGRTLRYHPTFRPTGTNVNFYHVEGINKLAIRTYEKGVEKETLACGTGALAAAYVYAQKEGELTGKRSIEVVTRSGASLIADFFCDMGEVKSLQMTGPATKVFEGHITLSNNLN